MDLEFTYDIVCPYAYLASQRIEALAAAAGATLTWKPVLLGGILKAHGGPTTPAQTWAANKVAIGAQDLLLQAALHGVELSRPDAHPRRTVHAMRVLCAVSGPTRVALTHALYRAYWVDGVDVADPEVVAQICRQNGVDPGALDMEAAKEALFACVDEAVSHGIFGVPSMRVRQADGACEGHWWGQDRLHMVAKAMGLAGEPSPPASPGGAQGIQLEIFHDFSSPFSYLASTQVEALAARHGATIRWTPILLGALFRSIGTPNIPLFAMSEAKRNHQLKDLGDWAAHWGVPFRFPSTFPVRTVAALRVALQVPSLTPTLYGALWVDDLDIGDPDTLVEILDEAGHDGATLLRRTQDVAIKSALRINTERAEATGACGVPTITINDSSGDTNGITIWGQDRLPFVASVLSDPNLRHRLLRVGTS